MMYFIIYMCIVLIGTCIVLFRRYYKIRKRSKDGLDIYLTLMEAKYENYGFFERVNIIARKYELAQSHAYQLVENEVNGDLSEFKYLKS